MRRRPARYAGQKVRLAFVMKRQAFRKLTNECGHEIEVRVAFQAVVVSMELYLVMVLKKLPLPEKQGDEDSRYHNVSETKHGKVAGTHGSVLKKVL